MIKTPTHEFGTNLHLLGNRFGRVGLRGRPNPHRWVNIAKIEANVQTATTQTLGFEACLQFGHEHASCLSRRFANEFDIDGREEVRDCVLRESHRVLLSPHSSQRQATLSRQTTDFAGLEDIFNHDRNAQNLWERFKDATCHNTARAVKFRHKRQEDI